MVAIDARQHQIQLLETVLERARRGELTSLVIVTCNADREFGGTVYTSVLELETGAMLNNLLDAMERLAVEPSDGDLTKRALDG